MRMLLLLIFAAAIVGCNSNVESSKFSGSANSTPDPDWQLPAGDHEIDDAWPPTEFMASIGGFSGASFKVELNTDGALVYHHNPNGFTEWGGTTEEIVVTEEVWNDFRDQLNVAEVWTWRKRYDDPKIADGTVWKLRIKYSDQTIVSSGSNAHPKQKQFNVFLDAVSRLADGKPFE